MKRGGHAEDKIVTSNSPSSILDFDDAITGQNYSNTRQLCIFDGLLHFSVGL